MKVRVVLSVVVLLCLSLTLAHSTVRAQDASDLCETAGNLMRNCRFDQGFRGLPGVGSVANSYGGYTISGRPSFNGISCDSPEPPCQRIWSDGELWEAGIYQQIAVTQGQGYRGRIGWLTAMCDDHVNQGRIGIDPIGGTDPNSPNIVWNPWIRLSKGNGYGIHQVKAAARNNTITVFISAKFQMQCSRGNAIWFDAAILVPDNSVAPVATDTPVSPTATPRPAPTNTRPPAPPTATRIPPTDTPAPTVTATATSTPTNTAMPTETSTETATASPTNTRRAPITPKVVLQTTPKPTAELATDGVVSLAAFGLLGASGCSLVAAIAMGAFALWYWKRK